MAMARRPSVPRAVVGSAEFKSRCLEFVDHVKEARAEYIVTRHGRPVARLVPAVQRKDSPFGWMKGTVRIVGDIVSSQPDEWQESKTDPLG